MKDQEITSEVYEIGDYSTEITVCDEEDTILKIGQESVKPELVKSIYGVTIRSLEEKYGSVWLSALGGLRVNLKLKDYMSYEVKSS